MRSRNIKPGFFKNEELASCEPLARILFAGLWCMADRKGRLEFRPKRIKAELLPYDDCDVISLIGQLQEKGLVTIYCVNGIYYLLVNKFEKHQHPHIKEADSTIPAPGKHGASTVQAPLIPDSFNLITESLKPESVADYNRTEEDEPVEKSPQEEKPADTLTQSFAEVTNKIRQKFEDQEIEAQVLLFINAHVKDANHDAILYCLNALLKSKKPVPHPKIYLEKIFDRVNGNFNEADHVKKANENIIPKDESAAAMKSIGASIKKKFDKATPELSALLPNESNEMKEPVIIERKKSRCSHCGKEWIVELIENGICFFCNPKVGLVICPSCSRKVGKNLIDSEHGFCHHCKPGN
ncbi:MAG: hypothetical protein ACLP9S_18590 [Syntrophales bacterium]